ncbi:Ankyrin repeat-containing protein [Spatholobus suberectus]|nr:Ankyrin repeat-containing protein [Spatholobus suberectus]
MSSLAIEGTEVDNVDQFSLFRGCVLEGRWEYVLPAYRNNSDFHKVKINESRGTALHVAVNDGIVELVKSFVGAIIEHEGSEVLRDDSALKLTNERGDTPLHLAASRGFIAMCKCIIGEYGERKDLIKAMNKRGETSLFRAVLTCQTKTFVYLHHVSEDLDVSLANIDGDTILHHAIWREFLDLAIIITHCYPELLNTRSKDGTTPLKVLSSKPSAFKSGSNLPWWKHILYYCILVEPLDPDKAIKSYMEKVDKSDDHEHKVTIQLEKETKLPNILVPQKYTPSVRFVKSVVRLAFKGLSLSGLGVTAQDLKAIKKIRQKHKWGRQLLNIFMKRPYESYMGITGGQPFMRRDVQDKDLAKTFITQQQLQMVGAASSRAQENNRMESAAKSEEKETTFVAVAKAGIVEIVNELQNKVPSAHDTIPNKENLLVVAMKNIKYKFAEHHVDKKETAFLAAAKNGIVEIVFALQSKIPSVVHETNSNNENVMLVAVKNRQTNVVEVLRKNLDKELFDSLNLEVDNRENTVLHLAAGTSSNTERSWQIAGAAMQMMWDIKWYQYVRDLVPEHFTFRNNKDDKTAGEIFKQKHKDLVKESSEWLKETSNSCSVVAALIAGVSFATSSSVPGGTDKGKPELEGQPAFDVFAIASLIGLCFSVTALIMFLAILTSRKQAQDFRKSLPLKLLFGLSSLFVSIASMLVSFCAAHFFVLKDKYKNILFPVYIATCLPVTFYAVVQFPLYADLLKAIFKKVPQPSITSSQF